MGMPAARISDMHVCPMVTGIVPHVGGPILPPGKPNVLIGKLPAATVTSMCTCVGPPDIIVKGSSGVFIGKLPAARLGDMTAHGGSIIIGCPTVLIGETNPGGGTPKPFVVKPIIASLKKAALSAKKTNPKHAAIIAQQAVLLEAALHGSPFAKSCANATAKK